MLSSVLRYRLGLARLSHASRPGLIAPMSRSLYVRCEDTPNPDAMKFMPDGPVLREDQPRGVVCVCHGW